MLHSHQPVMIVERNTRQLMVATVMKLKLRQAEARLRSQQVSNTSFNGIKIMDDHSYMLSRMRAFFGFNLMPFQGQIPVPSP